MTAERPEEVRTHPVPLRHNRDFLLLWTGQAASSIGSSVAAIAYPLLALAATGSAAKAGAVGFAALAATRWPAFRPARWRTATRSNRS